MTDGDDRVPRLRKETIQMQLAGLRRQGFRELLIPDLAGVVSGWRLVSVRERLARVEGLLLSSDQGVVVFRAPVADGSWPALAADGWLARRTNLLSAVQFLLGPVEGQS